MEDILEIAPLNPIGFVTEAPTYYNFEHAEEKCYYQKFQRDESTIIQVLSDTEPTCWIVNFRTGMQVVPIVPVKEVTNIQGKTFNVYNITIPFNSLAEGLYYVEIVGSGKAYYSYPLSVKDEHEGTIAISYKNSENNFSVVFTPDTIFTIRVEGTIQNFLPSSDNEIYNDQKRNATQLDGVPYRTFTLFIGDGLGVPDWIGDIVNRALVCNYVTVDGYQFAKLEGAEWDVAREPEYPFAGYSIDVMPTDNAFMERLVDGDEDSQIARKVLYRKSINKFAQGGDFNIPNVFRDLTLLDYVSIVRRSGNLSTIVIGITPGGDEVGTFDVTDTCTVMTIRWNFNVPSTLYFSGITGSNDISIVYEQLDEEGGAGANGGAPNPYGGLGVGAVCIYEGATEDFTADFNLSTGLGNIGTQWDGWAVCDGQNGTVDRRNSFPLGWKDLGSISTAGGSETITLTEAQLPEITPKWKFEFGQNNDVYDGRDGTFYSSLNGNRKHQSPIDRFPIEPFGGGEPITIMPPFIYSVYVKKIATI